MREIKFRAWNGSEMLSHADVRHLALAEFETETSTVWMQYTGLKDKNGVEIYEGDIVSVNECGEFAFNHKVVWSDGDGCYPVDTPNAEYDFTTMPWAEGHCDYEYAVIGNVHEHPELLSN